MYMRGLGHLLCLVVLGAMAGCHRQLSTTTAKDPKIASVLPSATDMLLMMGAGDHLVAVSKYDNNPDVVNLPRVGDYETVDWELLANLKPRYMIIQMSPDRLPQGFTQRASKLGIEFVNLKLDRLGDIYKAIAILGDKAGEQKKAAIYAAQVQAQLDAISTRVAGQPRVRTLVVISDNGQALAGPDTYLDDLLQLAGGENAAASLKARYPSADAEQVRALAPDAIIELLPGASPQVKESAARVWKGMPQVPAVRNGRVYMLTEPYALLPSGHVGDLAEEIARCLHPPVSAATAPSTAPTNGAP